MKDNKSIIKKLKGYIEKTEYWKYEDGLVLGSDEAQQLIEALEQLEKMAKEMFEALEELRILKHGPDKDLGDFYKEK